MKYQLHDYEIDSISLEEDRIIFSFPQGFYAQDEKGKEIQPLPKKLIFHIEKDSPQEPLEAYLHIRKHNYFGKRRKDISFQQFTALFKKGNMCIYDEYVSKFTNARMLQISASAWIEMYIDNIGEITWQ